VKKNKNKLAYIIEFIYLLTINIIVSIGASKNDVLDFKFILCILAIDIFFIGAEEFDHNMNKINTNKEEYLNDSKGL
jgi:hypothetical protein